MKEFVFIRLWATVRNLTKKQTTSKTFSKTLLKLLKLLFCRASLWWLLLFLDKNSKDSSSKTVLDFNNDSNLTEIDVHETSKRTTLVEQTLFVRVTPCLNYLFTLSELTGMQKWWASAPKFHRVPQHWTRGIKMYNGKLQTLLEVFVGNELKFSSVTMTYITNNYENTEGKN